MDQGEGKHLEETISTLKLAQRMMHVQNEVATIVETDPTILLRKYEKQIKELKHELVMHDALVERTAIVYDEHTPEQKHQLMKMIVQYVDAATTTQEDEALKLNSIHEIREMFRQFKILLKNAQNETLVHSNASIRAGSAGSNASRTQSSNGSRADIHHHGMDDSNSASHDMLVGEDDPGAVGFALGVASSAARPSTMDTVKKNRESPMRGANGNGSGNGSSVFDEDNGRSRRRSPSPVRALDSSIEDKGGRSSEDNNRLSGMDDDEDDPESYAARLKNNAFKFYKTGPGKKIHRSLQEEKGKLFDSKQKVKQITSRVNSVKAQIDSIKAKLEEKRSHRTGGSSSAVGTSPTHLKSKTGPISPGKERTGFSPQQQREEVVDEEEFVLMTSEREAKRDYRSLFDDLKEAKAEMEFTSRSVELLRMRLVREFEDWYESGGNNHARSKDDGSPVGQGDGFHSDSFGQRGRPYDSTGGGGSKDDKLDDGEKFDQMEVERIRAQDPDSLAFFQAQKKMRQQAGTTGSQRKSKRTS